MKNKQNRTLIESTSLYTLLIHFYKYVNIFLDTEIFPGTIAKSATVVANFATTVGRLKND